MNKQIAQAIYISNYAPQGQWIQIFPAGSWYGHDGRGKYQLSNPESVIVNSIREKTDLKIDRDHEAHFGENGAPVKAAAWMKEFEVRNGEIWAYVEWTPQAQIELANKEYRYFSPEFMTDKESGEITRITGGSLTNTPNFELEAVASEQCKPIYKEKNTMNKYLKMLATKLNLPEGATEEEIHTACAKSVDALNGVTKEFDIDEKSDVIASIKEKIETASQGKQETGAVDPSKYVPIDAHSELASQLKEIQKERKEDKAEASVTAAMEAGKISPAQKDWAIDYASQDLEGFKKFVEAAPEIVVAGAQTPSGDPKTDSKLTEEEAVVAKQLGQTEEEFLGTVKK